MTATFGQVGEEEERPKTDAAIGDFANVGVLIRVAGYKDPEYAEHRPGVDHLALFDRSIRRALDPLACLGICQVHVGLCDKAITEPLKLGLGEGADLRRCAFGTLFANKVTELAVASSRFFPADPAALIEHTA